jgi:hypothetical protein
MADQINQEQLDAIKAQVAAELREEIRAEMELEFNKTFDEKLKMFRDKDKDRENDKEKQGPSTSTPKKQEYTREELELDELFGNLNSEQEAMARDVYDKFQGMMPIAKKYVAQALKFPNKEKQGERSRLNVSSNAVSPKNIAAYLQMVHAYGGSDPEYLASYYFSEIERIGELHNLSNQVLLAIAKCRLKEKALSFARRGRLLENDDYFDFKDQIMSRFEPLHKEEDARYRLMNSVQLADETVGEYEMRLTLDLEDSIPRDVSDKKQREFRKIMEATALKIFIEGLKPELSQAVRFQKVDSMCEAAEIAKQEERALESRKKRLSLINPNAYEAQKSVKKGAAGHQINMVGQYSEEDGWCAAIATDTTSPVNPQIIIRSCMYSNDPNKCNCHLIKVSTSMQNVYETILCKNECTVHYGSVITRKINDGMRLHGSPHNNSLNSNGPSGGENNAARKGSGPWRDYGNQDARNTNFQAPRQVNNNRQVDPAVNHGQQGHSGYNGGTRFNSNNRGGANNGGQSNGINRMYKVFPQCGTCGRTNHPQERCRLAHAVCSNCNKVGHIGRMCKMPQLIPNISKTDEKLDKLAAMLSSICGKENSNTDESGNETVPKNL